MTEQEYENKYNELHNKIHELLHEAQKFHIRLLEIEEELDAKELETDKEIDYPDEHFDLIMELAYLMREQVNLSGQIFLLTKEYEDQSESRVIN